MKSTTWHSITILCIFAIASLNRVTTAFSPAKMAARHSSSATSSSSSSSSLSSFHRTHPTFDRHPPSCTRSTTSSSIRSSTSSNIDEVQSSSSSSPTTLRTTLRQITGFSLTTLRTTLRTLTGISLSASISSTLRRLLGVLNPSLRYFLQPLLIAYYAPILMVRYWMVGPNEGYVEESKRGHERLVDGWREAVSVAERASVDGYWPVHLNEDGTIATSLPPDPNVILDLTDGIEKSVAATTTISEAAIA